MWALGPLVPIAALAGAASSTPASAQTRTPSNVFMSENEGGRRFQEATGYSDAVVAGDTIYLSGVVVGLREGEDLGAAYDRTYRQIAAILARAGAGWDDVVDMTSYHTDVTAQFDAMVAVHRRFVRAPFPAWTAIDVDRLVPAGGITEIKVVARRPQSGGERARRSGGTRR
ncbi:MAG TPA: Rid family hydrolase [Allosphingosinicella sp.]|jgi:enamine deaminase RidA (YjgF/YER057c/UK114 family)|nr:Rid family hydrolase [Allosphingosinicella sp.]